MSDHLPAVAGAVDTIDQTGGVAALRQALAHVDDQRKALAEAGDIDSLAHGWNQIRPLLADLRALTEAIEADLARLMPDKLHEVPGVGVLERRKGTDRKAWDWPELLPLLIHLYVDPDGTGEMPDAGEVMERMKSLIVDVIGVVPSKGPKVTPLKALGVPVDEYCESKPGRVSVQLHGGDK